jgi:hypothetical protein
VARKTDPNASNSDPKGPVLVEETIEDAVVLSSGTATDVTSEEPVVVPQTAEKPDATEDADDPAPKPDVADGPDAVDPQDTSAEFETATDRPDVEEPTRPEPAATPIPPAAPAPQVTVQKVGFVPLVLGGAIAAALGFGVAWTLNGQQDTLLSDQIAAQSARIVELETLIATLPTDLAPVEAGIAEANAAVADLSARVDQIGSGIATDVAAFEERLVAVERAPGVDGTLAETAIASWEQELGALRAEIASQQDRMATIATSAQAELDATRAAAEQVEQDAVAAAQEAVMRAALARVQVALDSGTPYDAALGDLTGAGTDVPAALSDFAAEGVPTIVALTETFPEAARAALAAARSAGEADVDINPVTAFLRNQFDVRSVAPRDGTDPDAILSRAGAALADNRLTDALAEIATLPEVARVEMSDWTARAEARAAAMAAVETLDQSMNN